MKTRQKRIYLTAVDQPGGCGNHGGLDVHGDGGSGVAVRPRVREVEGALQLSGASPRYRTTAPRGAGRILCSV